MSNDRPQWYHLTVRRLIEYSAHKKRITALTVQLQEDGPKLTPVYSSQPHGTGTSDPTGNQGERSLTKRLELREREQEIRLIDTVVGMLSAPKKLIIEVRYLTEDGHDKAARLTLKANAKKNKWRMMHHSTYEKLRDEAVREVAKMLGEVDDGD